MIIEVTGTSTHNKGAELMLLTIKQHFEERFPQATLATDASFGTWQERGAYGIATKFEIRRWGRSRVALQLMPSSFRKVLGVVREAEVDFIIDAAGFAFGDQHPLERIRTFAVQAERWKTQGKPVILLPQALGPFRKPGYDAEFSRIVNAAKLVFARDPLSMQYAEQACCHTDKLRLAPDFTNLLKPSLTRSSSKSRRICIVPNQRMLKHAVNKSAKESYFVFLQQVIEHARAREFEPVGLLHGVEDGQLIGALNKRLETILPVENLRDPLSIKRFIGESHLVIGSRFHALVSALSQCVPALATSWSHKYEALFADYNQERCILPVDVGPEVIKACFDRVSGTNRKAVVDSLRRCAKKQEKYVHAMWDEVDDILGFGLGQDTV